MFTLLNAGVPQIQAGPVWTGLDLAGVTITTNLSWLLPESWRCMAVALNGFGAVWFVVCGV